MMPTVMGYADRVSVAPGEAITFYASVLGGGTSYRAELVRLICGDTGPKGPGLKEEKVATALDGAHDGFEQFTDSGSYAVVPLPAQVAGFTSFTAQALVLPTRHRGRWQAILGTWDAATRAGFALGLDERGALALLRGDGKSQEEITTGIPLRIGRWHYVAASWDAAAKRVCLHAAPLHDRLFAPEGPIGIEAASTVGPSPAAGSLLIAASLDGTVQGRRRSAAHFNGKIEAPSLARRAVALGELREAGARGSTAVATEDAIGSWDFAAEIPSDRIIDRSPNALHGVTINAPKRAVTGARWDGSVMDWRHAPEHYAAIHFHDDDLYDAAWQPSLSLTIPETLRSGAYALKLRAEGAPFHIGFFVRPKRGAATAKVAFLASTATYLAYANYRRRMVPGPSELGFGCLHQIDLTDVFLAHHCELGSSTYDQHSDGSGVCYASIRRPMVSIRPTGRLWNFQIDLSLLDWLEQHGIAYDVVTDHDLHAEGAAAVAPYSAVLTGCHPEYHSTEMLDALEAYLGHGGRLMYMGGNGFYWRVSWSASHPGLMEVRRTEDGTRAWAEVPGESYHSSTGEYGGLWRRLNRAPNRLAGIGFVAQGFDASSYYRRLPAASDPRARFIFDGVEGEILGDWGVAMGGAAGLEVDALDLSLGSPPHALVVASSENHSNAFWHVNEEQQSLGAGITGPLSHAVRADMTFFETPAGGAVFATGSIAYLASLWRDGKGYDNNISRLTLNVLKRFMDPMPFEMPKEARAGVPPRG
jgi:N,N-dimethylformamidase